MKAERFLEDALNELKRIHCNCFKDFSCMNGQFFSRWSNMTLQSYLHYLLHINCCYNNAALEKILQHLASLPDEWLSPHSKVFRLVGALLHVARLHVVWALHHVPLFCLEPMDIPGKLFSFQIFEGQWKYKSLSLRLRTGPLSLHIPWAWWSGQDHHHWVMDWYSSGRNYKITWQKI